MINKLLSDIYRIEIVIIIVRVIVIIIVRGGQSCGSRKLFRENEISQISVVAPGIVAASK